ncbi:MAG: aminopeptidase P N-terminal domain-containing protein [Bacteroidota bacterium]
MRYTLKYYLILTLILGSGFSFAQELLEPSDYPSKEFHQNRRLALRKILPPNSVAVFFANAVRNRSNDVDHVYHQDPNFYYLTGYREPNAVLFVFKEEQTKADGTTYSEIIFVQPRDKYYEMWTGRRLGPEGAKKKLGLVEVFNNYQFQDYRLDFSTFDSILFMDFENDVRDDQRNQGDLFDLIAQFKKKVNYPVDNGSQITQEPITSNLDTYSLRKIMGRLRGVKTVEEISLLRKAIFISAIGQIEVMKAMRPGISEPEVQGIHEFVYKKYGAEYEGYPSIVGAGHNGCILHYTDNKKPHIESGEMVLMDLGAEYRGYTADITRTIPVSGKFNDEQKAIYEVVLKAETDAIKACHAGGSWNKISGIARKAINQGLFNLGIIDSVNQKHNYFPHGLSHHIGLDVHDTGPYDIMRKGMVFTIEPGIYIPEGSNCDKKWWGIAIRIEDDILINENGKPEILSAIAPRTVEEIEKMMSEPSALSDFNLPEFDDK